MRRERDRETERQRERERERGRGREREEGTVLSEKSVPQTHLSHPVISSHLSGRLAVHIKDHGI
jgi:hypothetical protein